MLGHGWFCVSSSIPGQELCDNVTKQVKCMTVWWHCDDTVWWHCVMTLDGMEMTDLPQEPSEWSLLVKQKEDCCVRCVQSPSLPVQYWQRRDISADICGCLWEQHVGNLAGLLGDVDWRDCWQYWQPPSNDVCSLLHLCLRYNQQRFINVLWSDLLAQPRSLDSRHNNIQFWLLLMHLKN